MPKLFPSLTRTLFLSAAALSTSELAAAGGVAVFRGAPGAAGDVVVVDPSGVQPPFTPAGLAGITLRPLDVNGRTEIDALRSDRAQLRSDVPAASRVVLPGGLGSLYRYSRPSFGGLQHGLFMVDAAGDARIVFERAGVGLAGNQPPFLPRIAVAPTGDKALLLTRFDAGGDALEIDLASGAVLDRTAALAPQRFVPSGSYLNPTFGVFATNTGVWRFDRASGGDASAVPMPGALPPWFSGEIAVSRNGDWAVTTAGLAEDQAHVFVFGASGPALQVTTAAAWISPAGFLPDHLHGPYLAISDDGSHCAWRTEGVAREAWLAPVPQAQPVANHWLTSDTNYLDTIDEIGQYMFRIGSDVLVYSAGELSATGAPVIEKIDFYQAELPLGTTTPTLLNLTQSSGIAQPPFLQPADLDPSFVHRDPLGDSVIFHNQSSGGTGQLLGVQPGQPGALVLLSNVKELAFVESAGGHVFVNLLRSNGQQRRELHHFSTPFTAGAPALLSSPGTNVFDRTAARADGWFAFVERGSIAESLWRFDPALGTLKLFTQRPLSYGPAIDWAGSGELAFSVGSGAGASIYAAWPTAAPVFRLPIGVGPGFILP